MYHHQFSSCGSYRKEEVLHQNTNADHGVSSKIFVFPPAFLVKGAARNFTNNSSLKPGSI